MESAVVRRLSVVRDAIDRGARMLARKIARHAAGD
jgi:hypothetical protein